MKDDPAGIVALFVGLLALVAPQEVARLVGPYAAIFVCAVAGSGVAITLTPGSIGIWHAAWFMSLRVLMAWSVTVSIAQLLNKYAGIDTGYTIAPIAILIGAIRDFREAWEFLKSGVLYFWKRNGTS